MCSCSIHLVEPSSRDHKWPDEQHVPVQRTLNKERGLNGWSDVASRTLLHLVWPRVLLASSLDMLSNALQASATLGVLKANKPCNELIQETLGSKSATTLVARFDLGHAGHLTCAGLEAVNQT